MKGQRVILFAIEFTLVWISLPTNAQVEEWKNVPCGAVYRPKNCENTNLEALETVQDFERCGPALLDPIYRDYVWHGAGSETTLWENGEAFKRIRIKKRVMRGLSNHSLETTVMGGRLGFPFGISPTAGQRLYHPDGEIGMGRGAGKTGAVMILDSLALTSLEEVAAAVPRGTQLWIQMSFTGNYRETAKALVRRAEKAGYKAFVVTVDEPMNSDVKCSGRTKFFSSHNYKFPNRPSSNISVVDSTVTFNDVKWITDLTTLPVIAKGVLTKEDALLAIEAGVSGIFVSNHGGREMDFSLPTIDALPEIVDAVHSVNPYMEVYVDGGIRSGYDVFKALAMGAKAAFIGRPAIWGLAIGGEGGVERLLSIIKEEFRLAMVHAGFRNPSEITRSSLLLPTCRYADYPSSEEKWLTSPKLISRNYS